MNNPYNFSIIIPHKNIPDLLQRCLDSIPKREDIQIIIVDDNSDPNIVDFERFPGLNQTNVEVYFDKSNKGAGRARNVGIEHARGEWLLFADADDVYISDNLIDLLSLVSNNERYQVICWPTEVQQIDGKIEHLALRWTDKYGGIEVLQSEKLTIRDNYVTDVLFRMYEPWHKMCRSSYLLEHDISFSEAPTCNDLLFSVKLAATFPSIAICNKFIYRYINRQNSLSRTKSMYLESQRQVEFYKAQKVLQSCNKEDYLEDHYRRLGEITKKNPILGIMLCIKQSKIVSLREGIKSFLFLVQKITTKRRW